MDLDKYVEGDMHLFSDTCPLRGLLRPCLRLGWLFSVASRWLSLAELRPRSAQLRFTNILFLRCFRSIQGVPSPVRLDEDAIHMLQRSFSFLIADHFDEGGDGQLFGSTKNPFSGACDEIESVATEHVMTEFDAIKLLQNELLYPFVGEPWKKRGVGDTTAQVFVADDAEGL